MKLSLVVPCYNEEGNVERFFCEVRRVFSENGIDDYEFVFVNDGSRDGTHENLKALYEKYKNDCNFQIISFSRNFGKEAAIYAGMSNAVGDMVCLIDADLQQRPEVVVEMLREIEKDNSIDCVTAYQEERKESGFMSACKSAFYKVINKVSEVEFVNGASDFRLIKRNMVDAVLEMSEFHRFSKGLFGYVGFNTKYIPYQVEKRESGESKWNFKSLFKYALDGIFAFSTAPLKLATYSGLISVMCSLIYLIVVIIGTLSGSACNFGNAAVIILILLIGGIQLISLGILGEYISKIYVQVKHRPVYILKEHLSNVDKDKENI